MNDENGIFWGEYGDGSSWWDYLPPSIENTGGNFFIPINNDPSVIGGNNFYDLNTQPGNTMNEDDEFFTNDTTQTGGFWNDLTNLFGGVLSTVTNTAAGAATAAGNAWVNKNIRPAPAAPAATPAAGSSFFTGQNGILLLAAAGLAAFLIYRRR
jgi:hypothetical protein